MQAKSSPVMSNQAGIHQQLTEVVLKHLNTPYQRPIAEHTRQAFTALCEQRIDYPEAIIFDSCCGTGMSSYCLAEQFPQAWVIGIDRSFDRLQRAPQAVSSNVTLVQADCVDLWRLARQQGWRLAQHFILYPNPYPKAAHLQRRWHAHAVFPDLLALGGRLEVRSNWRIYIEEMVQALQLAGYEAIQESPFTADTYLTLFERKYALSTHTLHRCEVQL